MLFQRRSPYEVYEIRGKVNDALYFHEKTHRNYSFKIFPYSAKLHTGYLAKLHAAVDALGNPVRLLLTAGQVSEQGKSLFYDSNI